MIFDPPLTTVRLTCLKCNGLQVLSPVTLLYASNNTFSMYVYNGFTKMCKYVRCFPFWVENVWFLNDLNVFIRSVPNVTFTPERTDVIEKIT